MGIRFAQPDVMRCVGGRYRPVHRPRGVVDNPTLRRVHPSIEPTYFERSQAAVLPHAGERRPGGANVN